MKKFVMTVLLLGVSLQGVVLVGHAGAQCSKPRGYGRLKQAQSSVAEPLETKVYDAVINGDRRSVEFSSNASNLIEEDTNKVADVFVYYVRRKRVQRFTEDRERESDNWSMDVSVNYRGNVIAFTSAATTLSSKDTNHVLDVFVKADHARFSRGLADIKRASGTMLGLQDNPQPCGLRSGVLINIADASKM